MKPFLGQDDLFRRKEEIISQFPIVFGDYYEPFLRNGSIFFNLYNHKRVFGKAFLSTTDKDIVRAYAAVKEQPERVKKVLATCCAKNSKAFYDAMVTQMGNPSVLIYCYRAGYPNWREREFVQWNKPMTQDVKCIDLCSQYMSRWLGGLSVSKWEDSLMTVKENDLVFCDPQDFGCGSNAWLDDKYRWLEGYLKALSVQRKCHTYMVKDGKMVKL